MDQYARRPEDDRRPGRHAGRDALAASVGADGIALLDAVSAPDAPSWLREVPAVETLRRVWVQNYAATDEGTRWRTEQEGTPRSAQFISSPYDLDAHYGRKRTTTWIGYKIHLASP